MARSKSTGDHLKGQMAAQSKSNMTGFMSNIIQDKIKLNMKYRSYNITSSHSDYMIKLLNGMSAEKAKVVIEIEMKVLEKNEHCVMRVNNMIETRELILNMIHIEMQEFDHDKLNQLCNLINDLKKASINVILAIVEWRD